MFINEFHFLETTSVSLLNSSTLHTEQFRKAIAETNLHSPTSTTVLATEDVEEVKDRTAPTGAALNNFSASPQKVLVNVEV